MKRYKIVLSMRFPKEKSDYIEILRDVGIEVDPNWNRDDGIRAMLKWAGAYKMTGESHITLKKSELFG